MKIYCGKIRPKCINRTGNWVAVRNEYANGVGVGTLSGEPNVMKLGEIGEDLLPHLVKPSLENINRGGHDGRRRKLIPVFDGPN